MKSFLTFTTTLLFWFNSVSAKPSPIDKFDIQRYSGVWYEIARIENSFEEGLSNVTATYTLRDDGRVKVVNKGYNTKAAEWDEADGYAVFGESENIGFLEVTFFWPFFADYVIFEIDPEYQHAYITSDSKDYLWLLARTPIVSDKVKEHFLERAKSLGFKLDDLIFVSQTKYIEKHPRCS